MTKTNRNIAIALLLGVALIVGVLLVDVGEGEELEETKGYYIWHLPVGKTTSDFTKRAEDCNNLMIITDSNGRVYFVEPELLTFKGQK